VEIITEHGQDVQIFIDDQQRQIIVITVVVEGATGQHLRSKCQLDFIADHSELETAGAAERESKTEGLGQGSTSCEQVNVP
jgi:hypothetical protein